MVIEYNAIIALNNHPKSWTVAQLKAVLKLLKTKDDAAMPSKKADLYARYVEWIGRTPRAVEDIGEEKSQENGAATVYQRETVLEEITDNNEETEDCITAMLLLNDAGTEEQFQAENI